MLCNEFPLTPKFPSLHRRRRNLCAGSVTSPRPVLSSPSRSLKSASLRLPCRPLYHPFQQMWLFVRCHLPIDQPEASLNVRNTPDSTSQQNRKSRRLTSIPFAGLWSYPAPKHTVIDQKRMAENAVLTIQSWWRSSLYRRYLIAIRARVVMIQAFYRFSSLNRAFPLICNEKLSFFCLSAVSDFGGNPSSEAKPIPKESYRRAPRN